MTCFKAYTLACSPAVMSVSVPLLLRYPLEYLTHDLSLLLLLLLDVVFDVILCLDPDILRSIVGLDIRAELE